MKSDSNFPQLPALAELLQHPAVTQVLDRVNQSTIAQRATGFLGELRASWRDRAPEGGGLSLEQIAERLARRLLGPPVSSQPAINATGMLCGAAWHVPWAESAVQEMLRVAGEFGPVEGPAEQAASLLTELTGAEAACVLGHYSQAVQLVQQDLQLSAVRDRYAGILDPQQFDLPAVDTLANRLESGAELVVCDGGGLIGGPSCGIVLGRRQAVDQVLQHPWAATLRAGPLTLVALVATLSIYQQPARVMHRIPLWQLLTAPMENLQQRSARLAALIADSDHVATAQAVTGTSVWYATEERQLLAPTGLVEVTPAQLSLSALQHKITTATPPLITRAGEESLLVDLRSVFPRWDQSVVEVFQ